VADDEESADPGETRMSLIEHLVELRRRIVISFIAIAVGGVVGFLLYNHILEFLTQPYCDAIKRHPSADLTGCQLVITDPLEGLATRLKVSTYVGLVLAGPVVLFQLWRFITPGLYPREKRYAIPFVVSSMLLFLLGATVAVLTFPKALDFLIGISGDVATLLSPGKYISLYTLVMIAFGAAFEFPVVLVFLEIANIVTPRQLLGWWRYAIVSIFVIAAVITPSQDPYSLFGMALPMTLFYFLAILVGRLLKK
jgi:sec-independent protein translocase protein TatC